MKYHTVKGKRYRVVPMVCDAMKRQPVRDNPGKRERERQLDKADLVALNMQQSLSSVPRTSGAMASVIAKAKDRSPHSVAHVPALGAGQGKKRPPKPQGGKPVFGRGKT